MQIPSRHEGANFPYVVLDVRVLDHSKNELNTKYYYTVSISDFKKKNQRFDVNFWKAAVSDFQEIGTRTIIDVCDQTKCEAHIICVVVYSL